MWELTGANWEDAKLHARATAAGKITSNIDRELCNCCGMAVSKEDIPLCEHIKELEVLGSGFPLYFIFLKYSIIMIFLLLVSYSALSLAWAYEYNQEFCLKHVDRVGKDGESVHCTSWMVLLSRLDEELHVEENILRITSFITQLFFLLYIREQLRKHNAYFHQREAPKISDYAVLIKHIPKQNGIKKKIAELFKKNFSNKFKVEQIHPIAYLQQLQDSSKMEQLEHKRYLKIITRTQTTKQDQVKKQRIQTLMSQLQLQDRKKIQELNDSIEKDEVMCEKAIVILSTQKDKEELLRERISSNIAIPIFGNQARHIKIVATPEPNEIIYQNINLPWSTKIRRIILGWVLFVALLAVVTAIFYLLLSVKAEGIQKSLKIYKKDPIASSNLKLYALLLVLASTVLIVLFNKLLLAPILHKITEQQRHKTAAALQLSFSIKYALGLVFTTAILTLLVENLRFHNIYQHDYGVVEEETMMYCFAAFFVPLIWLTNPWYVWKRVKQILHRGSELMTQTEANQLMENPEYNIGKRYGEIIEMVWFTYFYASLIPIGAPLTLIGTSLFYWVDKYNLLRKSSFKQIISGGFCMQALVMLDLTLVLKPIGQIVFDVQIRNRWNYESAVLILIAIVYICLPKDTILDWINGEKFKLKRESFKEIDGGNTLQMYTQINQKIVSREWNKNKAASARGEGLSEYSQTIDPFIGQKIDRSKQCPEEQ